MILRMAAGMLALGLGAGGAEAKYDPFPDIERPLYPEVIVPTDDSHSADPELTSLRAGIEAASGMLVKLPDGAQVYDPEAMMPLLADEVEIFMGQGHREQWHFVSMGRQKAAAALEIAGRLSRGSGSVDPVVQQRYGMHFLARMAGEPTVGRTPWLDGRICTASYGQLKWNEWLSLWEKLRLAEFDDWRIAVVDGKGVGGWPKRYQMVPVAAEQKRSGGWIGVVSPEGGTVFFETWPLERAGHFAKYLNNHLCFEKQADGAWKVSAIAIRLD